jgi:uncharacterized protein involved in cysteine biosynthesis
MERKNNMGHFEDLKVPDLWYDVYARLLPGTAFVGAAYYLFSTTPKTPDWIGMLIALLCGYFFGLVAQPASSRITGWLHYIVAKAHGKDRLYVEMIRKELDDRQSMILSKMHGETTFFVQCTVLGSILLLIRLFYPQVHGTAKEYALHVCLCLLFLIEAVEVADRRFRRALDQKAIKDG